MATAPRLRLLALGARAATVRSTDSVPARGAPALRASFGSSSRSSSATAPRAAPTAPTTLPRPQATTTATAISRGVRWSSESAAGNKIWTFDEVRTHYLYFFFTPLLYTTRPPLPPLPFPLTKPTLEPREYKNPSQTPNPNRTTHRSPPSPPPPPPPPRSPK